MNRRIILPALTAGLLALGSSSVSAGDSSQTKHVKAYGVTLTTEKPVVSHMMGSASGGETMVGGKNATCFLKGSLGPKSGKPCNHHVEVHITKSGKVDIHATVSITLTNGKTHTKIVVPIMKMFGKDVRDYHYGNNIYAPAGTYRVDVGVDKERVNFTIKF